MKFSLDIENIKYIKISYEDYSGTMHASKGSIKSVDDREIIMASKLPSNVKIKTPQKIVLSIVCEDGLYYSETSLKYIEEDDPYFLFAINIPKEMFYKQKREYFRVKINYDVNLIFGDSIVSSKIYDLSANGVCIKLNHDIEIPENVRIEIILPERKIRIKAKFIRKNKDGNILKASFNFLFIDENDRNLISKKCIQKQIEDRRNTIM